VAVGCASPLSDEEAIDFVRQAWELTDITDGVLRETFPVEYDGIPFKDWIEALCEAPNVVDALADENYEEAAEEAARIGSEFAINKAIEQAGLSGVAAFASAAYWPIDASISAFRDAAADAAFENELDLYIQARDAGNSHDDIVTPNPGTPGGLLPNGAIRRTGQGWLSDGGFFEAIRVPNYTPQEFFDHAREFY